MTDAAPAVSEPPSRTPRADRTTTPAWVLTGAGVALQVTYPLLDDPALRVVTVASVVLFLGASRGMLRLL